MIEQSPSSYTDIFVGTAQKFKKTFPKVFLHAVNANEIIVYVPKLFFHASAISLSRIISSAYINGPSIVTIMVDAHARISILHDINEFQSDDVNVTCIVKQDAYVQYQVLCMDNSCDSSMVIKSILQEKGARAKIRGSFLLRGKQNIHLKTTQEHMATQTESDLLIKSVLYDSAHLQYDANIYIAKSAQYTAAAQHSKVLLLSDTVSAQTRPQLEVLNDDVTCSHGSAIGKFEDDLMFYLNARGFCKKEAQDILITGFLQDSKIDRPPFDVIASRIFYKKMYHRQ